LAAHAAYQRYYRLYLELYEHLKDIMMDQGEMKAAILYGSNIRYGDWPEPQIEEGTIKVKVIAVGICGSDVPRVLGSAAHFYPIVLRHEFSGDVVEVGKGVASFKPGDTVTGVPLLPCMKCENCLNSNFLLGRNYSFIGSNWLKRSAQTTQSTRSRRILWKRPWR